MNVINIIIGLVLAAIAYYIAGLFLPSPIPVLIAVVIVIVALFGNSRVNL